MREMRCFVPHPEDLPTEPESYESLLEASIRQHRNARPAAVPDMTKSLLDARWDAALAFRQAVKWRIWT